MPSRRTPASWAAWNASRVAKGVAEGVSTGSSPAPRVAEQLEQVGPLERVATGEDHHRRAGEAGDLLNEGLGFRGAQLARIGLLLRRGTAMLADQVAGLGDLVVEHQRTAREIIRGVGACGMEMDLLLGLFLRARGAPGPSARRCGGRSLPSP